MESKAVRVLLVDEVRLMRMNTRKSLEACGFSEIIETGSGESALSLVTEADHSGKAFQLIVCDWHLKDLPGLDFLKKVRSLDSHKKSHFIMVSSENLQDSIHAAIEAGINDYIMKPATVEIMKQKTRQRFSLSQPD